MIENQARQDRPSMHITRYTDYSLRILMYLAVAGDKTVTIRDIAESYDISRNHLMKIVQELNARGYLKATRGKNGGLKLADKPENIRIGKLVREFEQGAPLVECFGGDNQCVITPACRLKNVFSEALASFFKTLDRYSLADLALSGPGPVGQALANFLPAASGSADVGG